MPALSAVTVVSFLISMALQIATMSLLPQSKGYTVLWPTLGAIACVNIAMFLFSRLIASGAQLSILAPLFASLIPLCVIAIAFIFLHESASVLKILLLVAASVLVGVSSTLR